MLPVLPASANTLAMIGEDALVPPTCAQPSRPWARPSEISMSQSELVPQLLYVSYTPTPVFGSATAETSATVRRAQPESCCQAGFVSFDEHPEPAPDQAVSVQPRELLAFFSDVPPTAVTVLAEAGQITPKPESPELAVIATPGWSKCESAALVVLSSEPPQLLEMATTPSVFAAVSSAADSGSVSGELASTSRMLQPGQIADTTSQSR